MHKTMFSMGRTRLTNQLDSINESDLLKRNHPKSNSAGWLLRHIVEVELQFAKNVFGREVTVKAQTIGSISKDRGQFDELQPLKELINRSGKELGQAVQDVEDWNSEVTTTEFRTGTKAEAFSRILTHTAYHAGQLSLAVKYGKSEFNS